MKCQILFSGKNKKNISKCRLLKILPRVLSVKGDIFLRIFKIDYLIIRKYSSRKMKQLFLCRETNPGCPIS